MSQDMLDPVWFPLFPGTGDHASVIVLPDWVQRGTVKSVKEDIDGHPCWRVDIAQPNPGFERYTVWIDRTVGCCPRRVQMVGSPANGGLVTYDYKDYTNVKKGVWFPKKRIARYTDFGQKGEFTIVTEVTSITASDIAKEAVLVKFPEGVTPNKARTATRKPD